MLSMGCASCVMCRQTADAKKFDKDRQRAWRILLFQILSVTVKVRRITK
jgi:hypothetical protein